MGKIIKDFFETYFTTEDLRNVYGHNRVPPEMIASEVDDSGWFTWKAIPGNLSYDAYSQIEKRFGVKFPKSFIEWHIAYFFC